MVIDPETMRLKLEAARLAWMSMAKTERERQEWVRGVIYGIELAMKYLPDDPTRK